VIRIHFDPLAEAELSEAVSHYDEISPQLGDALLAETGRVVEQLLDFPLSVPIWKRKLRRRPLARFPYTLVYLLEEDLVFVVAVIHQARGPKHIAGRLDRFHRHGNP